MRLASSIGDTHNLLTIASDPFLYNGNSYVLCDCFCGTRGKQIKLTSILSSHTKSCGCLRGNKKPRELKYPVSLGDEFGSLRVTKIYVHSHIKANGSRQKRILCDCDCSCGGKKKRVYVYNLIKHYTTSCGCKRIKTVAKRSPYQPNVKVGIFTLISKEENSDSTKGISWRARCSCGNERVLNLSTIRNSTNCTCPTNVNQSRYLNKEFNGWKVLRVYYKDKNQFSEAQCLSCGSSKPIRVSTLVAGKSARCSSCRR